jgi:hypothetical protein
MYPGHLRTPPLGPMSPMGTPAFGAAGGVRASPSVGPAHDYDPFRIRKPQSNAPARTKIICTLGPKSQDPEVLLKLLEAGMNVARLNFSHGSYEVNFFVLRKFFKKCWNSIMHKVLKILEMLLQRQKDFVQLCSILKDLKLEPESLKMEKM